MLSPLVNNESLPNFFVEFHSAGCSHTTSNHWGSNQAVSEDLKVGDVVVLNSGGSNMTVTHILQGNDPGEVTVWCAWFEGPLGNQKEKHSSFPIEALKKHLNKQRK